MQYLYQQSLPQLFPKDDEEDEDEDDLDEGLGDEGLIFPPLFISENLSTFNSLVESPLSFIENLSSSQEDDGCDEVFCANVYIEKLSITYVCAYRILGRELRVMLMVMLMVILMVMLMALTAAVVVMMMTVGVIVQKQLMLGAFQAGRK